MTRWAARLDESPGIDEHTGSMKSPESMNLRIDEATETKPM